MATHGHTRKNRDPFVWKAYTAWSRMKHRCYNPNYEGRHNYLDRGIIVCDRWLDSFENFLNDVGPPPTLNHTLDRIDNDLNYDPGNCRWAIKRVQQENQRRAHLITWNGKTQNVTVWAREIGIPASVLYARLKLKWSVERTLTTPKQRHAKDRREDDVSFPTRGE